MKALSKLTAAAFIITALFLTTNVKAQTTAAHTVGFSIGPDAGFPTGNLTIGSTFVLGGTPQLRYGVSNNFCKHLSSSFSLF